MKQLATRSTLGALVLTACSTVSADPVWTVINTTDPITNVRHCVVAAYDKVLGTSFTRTGYLYPFVENNSQLGVLVGVSSGGTIRVPVGNIVWRVDDKPFRTLQTVDNPTVAANTTAAPASSADEAMRNTVALAQRLAQTAAATSTAAGGPRAQEMLTEMTSGTSLVFRTGSANPTYGLPNPATSAVGQFRNGELKPYQLDASFRDGLAACGIRPG